MARPVLDDDAIQTALEMREAGRSCPTIAKKLGVTAGAIHYQCLKHGVVSPNQRRTTAPTEPRTLIGPTGRVQRAFTQAEDEQLLALEAQGLTYKAIARTLGRAYTSVRMRLLAIALRDEMAA
ncbi:hypothetical protein [Sphingomonas sanguinis]|uniref:hypothetical protein n=1 Tax=Sphingomonas sanguinis TaxID=33051 RepID=UPI00077BFFDE|nr:hypothetical protein [Sphingomonas sanguinis]